jgi:hypothetical protein
VRRGHVIGGAKGQHAIGVHRTVVEHGRERFEYDVRCEDCGTMLGFVRHDVPRVGHDPADCGLICGDCGEARVEPEEA